MKPKPHDQPIPRPRPIRYRVPDDRALDDKDFHEIRIALTMLCEDEGKPVMDSTIRAACYDACDMGDLRTVGRIHAAIHDIASAKGKKTQVGPVLASEIMDAISRMWDEYENGDERAELESRRSTT